MAPSPDEVRSALQRVLESEGFANAGRVSRLLSFVVDRTLQGQGDELKEYVLGLEVFDRGDDFDPRVDSIVRVEARRLRARLEDYYRGAGAADPVVISIPRGSYVPVFAHAAPAPSLDSEIASDAEPVVLEGGAAGPALRWRFVIAAAAAAALLVVAASGWRSPGISTAPEASTPVVEGPVKRLAVLPFATFSTDPEAVMLAARITDGVTTELARLGTLAVVSRTSAAQFLSDERPVPEVAQILGADLIMEGSAIVEGGRVKVSARLVDGMLDRKVWVGEYEGALDAIASLHGRIAAEAGPAALKIATPRR